MQLHAKLESFDSFWEAPSDIEKGYTTFNRFYKNNYLKYIPKNRNSRVMVVSCGPGYFVNLLQQEGYANVFGIDSDAEKIRYAREKGLNCEVNKAFDFLENNTKKFDCIIAEQEINHLTIHEMLKFFELCQNNLKDNGILILHSINGANPITGAESLTQNIDHFNAFTEYSFRQILEYAEFEHIVIFPLKLYVFYYNPLNYIGLFIETIYSLFFRFSFLLYGKHNRIFTKKIGAVCRK